MSPIASPQSSLTQRHPKRPWNKRRQVRDFLAARKIEAVIPARKGTKGGDEYDREKCKWRHLIENFFCKIKAFRRIATRYEKTDACFTPSPMRLSRDLLTRGGFSDELGTVMYDDNNQDEVFLGYSMGQQQTLSEATAQKIDAEVRRLVEAGLAEATRIIIEKREDLETLAKGLLEYETLRRRDRGAFEGACSSA